MSIAVALEELESAAGRYGETAFLLTGSDDGRPHISHVRVAFDGGNLRIPAGRSSRRNAAARPLVVVLWPPHEPGGFSLIVDAEATDAGDDGLQLVPTNAVLHRPAS